MRHGRSDYDNRIQDSAKKIAPDEPVFLLRGQDRWAARVVRYYADLLEASGTPQAHIDAVRKHALEMQNWRPKKSPDYPEGGDR
jgi:hypothetical protein